MGNNPVRYVDPDGRITVFDVLSANPETMNRADAISWIYDKVVNDNKIPICQFLYKLGLLGYKGPYDFSPNEVITTALANADSYANKRIKDQVKKGEILPASIELGETAFSPYRDLDLYGAFGGGCGFTWKVESVNDKDNTVKVKVYFEDTFDFNESANIRSDVGEKLTAIGRRAGLSSFKISGYYYLSIKVRKNILDSINDKLNNFNGDL